MERTAKHMSTILPVVLAVSGIIIAITYKAIGDMPRYFYILMIIFMVLLTFGWLMSLFVVVRSYNENKFDEIEEKFSRSAQQIKAALFDIHITSVHSWIVPDSDLFKEYEK